MLIDINILVKTPSEHKTFYIKNVKDKLIVSFSKIFVNNITIKQNTQSR